MHRGKVDGSFLTTGGGRYYGTRYGRGRGTCEPMIRLWTGYGCEGGLLGSETLDEPPEAISKEA